MSIETLIDTVAKQTAFYTEQADKCAKDARDTPLESVRGKNLGSETSWRGMADLSATREATLREDAAKLVLAAEVKASLKE
ncbi:MULTISPECIES: hypothetical protein [unclassified Aureimonas]|uniref:hypothetical protein n=1 Tax=unclassified Aureimonas TaxID=2615206 RepID=UPI0006F90001|nr:MULTISPECIES: hypothetical protein [unclassified Aureimonas]KQT60355.1 hypothetical protein ASG62_06770 [Aureimonas sp. Leaf427]KQT79232.1 hypothetical protein ASG54_09365 [Aureimonas sp. Leaf460]